MKQMKKILSVVLALVLSLSLLPVTSISAASKKVKLNKTKATIYVGKTVTLKLGNNKRKVKWSTSNKKVATVSKKGKVTGKKAGKTIITAKVGKKKYKCKITVKKKYNRKITEKDKQYKIIDQEIGYHRTTSNPEGSYYLSFGLTWKGDEISYGGTCDIAFMNTENKILKTKTVKFTSHDFVDIQESDGLKRRCKIDIDINDRPGELIGNGNIGFIIKLDNGQEFPLYTRNIYYTKKALSGQTIQFDKVSVVLPVFKTISTYSGSTKVSTVQMNSVEYAYIKQSNGTYEFNFWINGTKIYDIFGNLGTTKSGLCYSIQKDGENIMLKDSNISDLPGRYIITQPFGNRKVGERVGTYPTNCELSEGVYQLMLEDYKY